MTNVNDKLIIALYKVAEEYASAAQRAMSEGDRHETYRAVALERQALNRAHKLETFGRM